MDIMYKTIPPSKPWAFDARLVLGAGHLECNSVSPLGHLQATKNLLINILSSFPTALSVMSGQAFKHRHFGIRRAFINHKRLTKAIKLFALSFCSRSDSFRDLFYAVLMSLNSCFY